MKYLNDMIVIILFCCISIQKVNALSFCDSFADSVKTESINFYTMDSLLLSGTLYLPQNSHPKSIVVYIGRPDDLPPVFDFVNNTDSFASLRKMVDNLIRSDMGFFFLPMRVPYNHQNHMEIILSSEYRSQTLETLAEDAKSAVSFIKQDGRFKNTLVGVLGGSAMGLSAVMAAVQGEDISFVGTFSTPSTDNFDDAEYAYDSGSLNYVYLRGVFSELWSMVKDTTFIYEGTKYVDVENKPIEDQFIECAWDCFKKINRTIIAKYSDYNTIQQKATALMKSSFQWGRKGDWNPIKGMDAKNPDEAIDLLMWAWHKPIDVSFLRWNPDEWYSQLECPTLFLFAENDKIIDLKGSLANVERIKKQYNKPNFTIQVLKGCGHSFEYYYYIKDKKGEETRRQAVSNELFYELTNWLHSICNSK